MQVVMNVMGNIIGKNILYIYLKIIKHTFVNVLKNIALHISNVKTHLHLSFLAVYDNSASCLAQITVCVSDTVCNRYLAPVLQACMAQCDRDRCQLVTQQFYADMPHNVAEMLVMCKCDPSDHACWEMTSALHSGTCGAQTRICQDTVNQCVQDTGCRYAADFLSTRSRTLDCMTQNVCTRFQPWCWYKGRSGRIISH